jgi:hypothetical protein
VRGGVRIDGVVAVEASGLPAFEAAPPDAGQQE